jgi:hypothetical protein
LPEGREGRKLKTQNRKKIMTVHNENKRRKEVFKIKERHNKNLTNEVVTEWWKYSMKEGKGE